MERRVAFQLAKLLIGGWVGGGWPAVGGGVSDRCVEYLVPLIVPNDRLSVPIYSDRIPPSANKRARATVPNSSEFRRPFHPPPWPAYSGRLERDAPKIEVDSLKRSTRDVTSQLNRPQNVVQSSDLCTRIDLRTNQWICLFCHDLRLFHRSAAPAVAAPPPPPPPPSAPPKEMNRWSIFNSCPSSCLLSDRKKINNHRSAARVARVAAKSRRASSWSATRLSFFFFFWYVFLSLGRWTESLNWFVCVSLKKFGQQRRARRATTHYHHRRLVMNAWYIYAN